MLVGLLFVTVTTSVADAGDKWP